MPCPALRRIGGAGHPPGMKDVGGMAGQTTGMGARAEARCRELSRPPYSEEPDKLTRRFLTPAHRATIDRIGGWMREAGMDVRLDAAGSLVGRKEFGTAGRPALVFGSHVDSVRDAGAYDGMLGVLLGLACVEALGERKLPFAIEVVGFGDEEGSRFQASMNGSRAFAGKLNLAAALEARDREGGTLRDAVAAFGLKPESMGDARRERGSVLAFVEPHIEQGPVLEAQGRALGVVTSIAGQWRLKVRVQGMAGHAGTTPMHLRTDALAAAAEAVLTVERIATEGAADLVATVGQIAAQPGAPNVIAGSAEFTVDVRAGTDAVRDAGLAQIEAAIAEIALQRGVKVEIERVQNLPASIMDTHLAALLKRAAAARGHDAPEMVSGAGHDAMIVASLAPTAMLFIRCAKGISHNPAESVTPKDCEAALQALVSFIDFVAAEHGA
jgi:allantoate deiminase